MQYDLRIKITINENIIIKYSNILIFVVSPIIKYVERTN